VESEIPKAKYVRLYVDERGESHFQDLEMELLPVDFAPPAGPMNIAEFLPTTQSRWVGAPVGWAGDIPHPVPQRQVFVVSQGEFEVTASDGSARDFRPGDVLLIEDTWGKGRSTRVIGNKSSLVFAVVLADSELA
jgi:hypothetical protein